MHRQLESVGDPGGDYRRKEETGGYWNPCLQAIASGALSPIRPQPTESAGLAPFFGARQVCTCTHSLASVKTYK